MITNKYNIIIQLRISNSMRIHHKHTEMILKHTQCNIGMLDLSKAFDKVQLLEFYGIRGSILHWFKSFLTN